MVLSLFLENKMNSRISDQEEYAPVVASILSVVNSDESFSDLIIAANEPIMLRNASGWVKFPAQPYSTDDVDYVISTLERLYQTLLPQGGFSRTLLVDPWRLRINVGLASRGTRIVLSIRRTPTIPKTLKETGLPPALSLMVENPRGLVLLSGPTGSGKTTTMAALIDHINSTRDAHIMTIEDPIEYEFIGKRSIFTQQEVGADVPTFFEGVRGAMRKRPDVIVIGEIRDKETAENALLAGESGHLVIATLHASSCYGAIQKLLQFFPGEEEAKLSSIANSLMGVVNQALIPGASNRKEGVVAAELLFNHEQQFSRILGDGAKVNAQLDTPGSVSRSMATSLAELIKDAKIQASDAFRSIAGQGSVFKLLEEKLQKK
jgi:twitching motility protein PilT